MLRVLTWNILNGGRDRDAAPSRWTSQVELVRELDPDIWLMQEARGFDADGQARLLTAEHELGRRGFLSPAVRTGQHTAIFLKAGVRAVRTPHDGVHFHHSLARVDVEILGVTSSVQLASMHLSPLSPALRSAEVGWLSELAAPGALSIVGGDANSLAPGDPEPDDWETLAAHHRVRYLTAASGPPRADRGALAFLQAAGFVNAATESPSEEADRTPTVPTTGYPNAEFVSFRSDHILLSGALAPALASYQVITDERAQRTSDHLPVLVELDPARIR